MKKIAISLLALTLGVLLAVPAMAGPGSVEVTVPGDISLRMGAQVRIIPTSEVDRDFGVSDDLSAAQEKKAAIGLVGLGARGDSTRVHLTEGAGAVKDNYVRNENRLFFNFAKAQDWDVYMMLEMDSLWDPSMGDRTDFTWGRQTQQFGIERLNASFNLPALSSRLRGGWDARGVDIGFGGVTYADDDPGLGLVGGAQGWKWEAWWIKKQENEAGYGGDIGGAFEVESKVNPLGPPVQEKDEDRDLYYAKLGYDFDGTYVEAFQMFHQNHTSLKKINHHVTGLQAKGTYGIVMPMAEVALAYGDYKAGAVDADISSWAAFADVAFDLHEAVGIKKFEPHIGYYYLQGDDDPTDDDFEGFAPVTGISRFTPRFGTEQSISHDGNLLLGQIEYSMFPAYYGTNRARGAGINAGNAYDNPGFQMIGGGLKTAWDNWSYKGNLMAMWFAEEKAVEAFYEELGISGVKIDNYMGLEWNNELAYKLYDQVTLKLGVTFLFPGNGAEDITQAVDAYARAPEDAETINFADGKSYDDISQRYAAEIVWFF